MKNPIARYLMCSYAYYVEDKPLIHDEEFDKLAKFILHNWNAIDHPHKHLITKGDLEAGTYLGKYPEMVKGAVRNFRETLGRRVTAPPMNWPIPEKGGLDDFFSN
mgnify:FL=1